MKKYLYFEKEPDLQKLIIASAVLHMLFIFLITIPIKTKDKEYDSYVVDLVAPARVLSPSDKSADGAAVAKPRPRRRVRAKSMPSKRVDREIERLRAISAIEKLREKKEEEKANRLEVIKKKIYKEGEDAADHSAEDEVAGRIKEIRDKVRGGTGIPGKPKAGKNTEFYYALITQKIWSEWICTNCGSEDFEVVISFHINKDGSVDSLKIVKSSGNSFYDNSALKAIRKASPLPPPVIEDDCEVRFRP